MKLEGAATKSIRMRHMIRQLILLVIVGWTLGYEPAQACVFCSGIGATPTLRQEAKAASMVLYGTLANARLTRAGGQGETDFNIEVVLKEHPILNQRTKLTLPRYVPVDAKNPPKFLIFCDVVNQTIDPYRGSPFQPAVVDYLRNAMRLDERDPVKALRFFFDHLDATDPEIAADAFREFAKASDQDIAKAAPFFDAARIRSMLQDTKTPPEWLGVLGYLLGVVGNQEDGKILWRLATDPNFSRRSEVSGVLAGYVSIHPAAGWKYIQTSLADGKRNLNERLPMLSTLRFFQMCKPIEYREQIIKAAKAGFIQGDLADLITEDLRRWGWWELTEVILSAYGRPTHAAPLTARAILRYAVACPEPWAKRFVAERSKIEPEAIRDARELLQIEQPLK
jgi:hypothetical protein